LALDRWAARDGVWHLVGGRDGAVDGTETDTLTYEALRADGGQPCSMCVAELRHPGLTREQRAVKAELDAEKARRRQALKDAERESKPTSTSVRAVSGGLPAQGKRR
jgi:hypothetical protein